MHLNFSTLDSLQLPLSASCLVLLLVRLLLVLFLLLLLHRRQNFQHSATSLQFSFGPYAGQIANCVSLLNVIIVMHWHGTNEEELSGGIRTRAAVAVAATLLWWLDSKISSSASLPLYLANGECYKLNSLAYCCFVLGEIVDGPASTSTSPFPTPAICIINPIVVIPAYGTGLRAPLLLALTASRVSR